MSNDVVEFRPTRRSLSCFAAIFLIGLTLPLTPFIVPIVLRNLDMRPDVEVTIGVSGLMANAIRFAVALFLVVIAFLFVSVGIFGLRSASERRIFSRRTGRFSRAQLTLFGSVVHPGADVSLNSIAAIQLLSTVVSSDSESLPYPAHELNLVLTGGSRVNVVSHGGEAGMHKDSALLSEFLEVPVWEISEH
ncbi:MAG: hypothetical protein DCF24_02540 [Cyanobium sp.]|nr:MAG: hypothetical protein DCF24_02540 [Cyanobium sp.]